jgi:hypothetical protein
MHMPPLTHFPKAAAVLRGCGERTPGGIYVECGVSPVGRPFEDFLVDPPLALPPGLGFEALANKPQFWTDPDTRATHLVLWIGEQFYPHVADFVEEARRFGISRKLSPQLLERPEFGRLTLSSRMILAHPRALNTCWAQQPPPFRCLKAVRGHGPNASTAESAAEWEVHGQVISATSDLVERAGPCLFQTWDLIPATEALPLTDPLTGAPVVDLITHEVRRKCFALGGRIWYLRRIGSTEYVYAPTVQAPAGLTGLQPGIFGAFPITGFALVKHSNGDVDARVAARLERLWQEAEIPYYRADR